MTNEIVLKCYDLIETILEDMSQKKNVSHNLMNTAKVRIQRSVEVFGPQHVALRLAQTLRAFGRDLEIELLHSEEEVLEG
jgi:hypothetical protein